MTRRRTGPGRIYTRRATDRTSAVLANFDIDGHELKTEHQQWLVRNIVPILREGGSVSVEGRASRTASSRHNQALSERRMNEVLDFLRQEAEREFEFAQYYASGERAATRGGCADGTEHDYYRAVVIEAWSRPTPPPPPPPPPPQRTPRTPGRVFKIRINSGSERIRQLVVTHNFVFEICNQDNDPNCQRSAIYQYTGNGIFPPLGPTFSRSGFDFVQSDWRSFRTTRDATVLDFETRSNGATLGVINFGSGRAPTGAQRDVAIATFRFRPRDLAPWRSVVELPARFSSPQSTWHVTLETVGRLLLSRLRT